MLAEKVADTRVERSGQIAMTDNPISPHKNSSHWHAVAMLTSCYVDDMQQFTMITHA